MRSRLPRGTVHCNWSLCATVFFLQLFISLIFFFVKQLSCPFFMGICVCIPAYLAGLHLWSSSPCNFVICCLKQADKRNQVCVHAWKAQRMAIFKIKLDKSDWSLSSAGDIFSEETEAETSPTSALLRHRRPTEVGAVGSARLFECVHAWGLLPCWRAARALI